MLMKKDYFMMSLIYGSVNAFFFSNALEWPRSIRHYRLDGVRKGRQDVWVSGHEYGPRNP
jgi:hypothetical protein